MNNTAWNIHIEFIGNIDLFMLKYRLASECLIVTYNEIKEYFTLFHIEKITKKELAAAIHLWQRTLN